MKKSPEDPNATDSNATLVHQLEQRLEHEKRIRRDAEFVAASTIRRLDQEQQRLAAISRVSHRLQEGNQLEDAGRVTLAALVRQTGWDYCRLFMRPLDRTGKPLALSMFREAGRFRSRPGELPTDSARRWLENAEPLSLSKDSLSKDAHAQDECRALEAPLPVSMPCRTLCAIGLDQECFGLLELFVDERRRPAETGADETLLLSLAHELARVYKSERDRRAMELMACQDPLTGLHNRSAFFGALNRLTRKMPADGTEGFALLYLDPDGFRDINDACGHIIGDRYLCRIADRMRHEMGYQELARLGSDEFAVLIHSCDDAASPLELANRLLKRLRAPITIDGHVIDPHFSAGLALYPNDATSGAELFNAAETALQHARENGGDRLRVYDAGIAALTEQRKQLTQQVRHAVSNDAYVPWYQPIVSANHRIIGAEALLRWNQPEAPGPAEFVPILESQGLMRAVGRQVLTGVIHTAARWQRDGLHLEHISVNVSPVQLREEAFVDYVARALKESGLPANCLILEITESLYISAEKSVLERLARLRRLGVKLALDDFGTGYSALGYLQWMPLDILKIDKSFVLKLAVDTPSTRDVTILRSIVQIAHACGLAVTAEGIESEAIARAMVDMGVHCLQGYHFSRPLPEARMRDCLSRLTAPWR